MPEPEKRSFTVKASPLAVLRSLLRDYFLAIFVASALALAMRVYVLEAFRIPTEFMAPTLLPGDHIFVNKISYAGFFGLGKATPERGDIIVFSFPNEPAKDYIKRVIGVSGDRIELQNGVLLLNGRTVSHKTDDVGVFVEEIGDHKYSVLWKDESNEGTQAKAATMTSVVVPPGKLFVLGDHRLKGQDSRGWGFIDTKAVKGRANLIWFSGASREENAFLGIRWSRVFAIIK